MTILYNENKVLHVHRQGEDELKAECYLLSNDIEATAWLVADIHDFTIHEAAWEVFRHPEHEAGHFPLPELCGIRAYLDAGGQIRAALGDKQFPLMNELLLESVRGYVQTVCLLLKEHGYRNTYEYFMNFKHLYDQSCLLYSDGNPGHIDWSQKNYHQRETVIFNRLNTATVVLEDEHTYAVQCGFSDSHHQLGALVHLDARGIVTRAEGDYARIPDPLCRENRHNIGKLVGRRLPGMDKAEIGAVVGGSHGCDHMVNMFYHTAQTLSRVFTQRGLGGGPP